MVIKTKMVMKDVRIQGSRLDEGKKRINSADVSYCSGWGRENFFRGSSRV